MKIAIHVDDASLIPCEQVRKLIEEALGEAPPVNIIAELALFRVDADLLATALLGTLMRAKQRQQPSPADQSILLEPVPNKEAGDSVVSPASDSPRA